MTTIDLPVVSARIAELPDIQGVAEDAGCDPEWLASALATAATPAIEAAVRAQIAVELEALDDNEFLKALVVLSPGAQAMLEWAAATARGES